MLGHIWIESMFRSNWMNPLSPFAFRESTHARFNVFIFEYIKGRREKTVETIGFVNSFIIIPIIMLLIPFDTQTKKEVALKLICRGLSVHLPFIIGLIRSEFDPSNVTVHFSIQFIFRISFLVILSISFFPFCIGGHRNASATHAAKEETFAKKSRNSFR